MYRIDQKESQPILLRNELVDSLDDAGSLDDIDVEAKFFNNHSDGSWCAFILSFLNLLIQIFR